MQPIVVTVAIDAPPNEVWAVVCDVEHWPDWTPTVHQATRLDQGPEAESLRRCCEGARTGGTATNAHV